MTERASIDSGAVQQLLDRARLTKDEVARRLKCAVDPSYWERLTPGFTVGRQTTAVVAEANPLSSERARELRHGFEQKGYFQTGQIFSESALQPFLDCIEKIRAERWPPVFAFVYDQVWDLTCTPSLERLRSEILGQQFKRTSRIWCFYVVPLPGSKGFAPHADGHGRSNRLAVWIALSDATLENGCIYVIPQDLVPDAATIYYGSSQTSHKDLLHFLQSSRALPAKAGSILGWNFNLIHWGSTCNRPAAPRISLAAEFIAESEEGVSDELPLLDGPGLPLFHQRLFAIAKGILDYEHHEPRMLVFRDLAAALSDWAISR